VVDVDSHGIVRDCGVHAVLVILVVIDRRGHLQPLCQRLEKDIELVLGKCEGVGEELKVREKLGVLLLETPRDIFALIVLYLVRRGCAGLWRLIKHTQCKADG
jgi:hypothetical protein